MWLAEHILEYFCSIKSLIFTGGTIGEVSVAWYVNPFQTTALRGSDFVADGATLMFESGETQRSEYK